MRTAILIIGVFIIAATLAWEFVPLRVMIWDGAFDLSINISSTGEPLYSVRCKGCGTREEAEWLLDNPSHPEGQSFSVVADPFNGKAISISVPIERSNITNGTRTSAAAVVPVHRRHWALAKR